MPYVFFGFSMLAAISAMSFGVVTQTPWEQLTNNEIRVCFLALLGTCVGFIGALYTVIQAD